MKIVRCFVPPLDRLFDLLLFFVNFETKNTLELDFWNAAKSLCFVFPARNSLKVHSRMFSVFRKCVINVLDEHKLEFWCLATSRLPVNCLQSSLHLKFFHFFMEKVCDVSEPKFSRPNRRTEQNFSIVIRSFRYYNLKELSVHCCVKMSAW